MRYKGIVLTTAFIVAFGLQGCGGGGTEKSSGEKESSLTAYEASSQESTTDTLSESKVTEVAPAQAQSSAFNDTNHQDNDVDSNTSHVYILKRKSITYTDHNETTVYDLNASSLSYIAYSTMRSTTGEKVEKKYDYNTTSKTLNVYVKNIINEWELTQVAEFEEGKVKDIVDFTHDKNSYMINTFDPISFSGYRVVKNIKDIEMGLFNVQTFKYDENGSVTSITAGYLDSLDDENMTVESENVLETNVSKPAGEPVFSDDNMTVSVGGSVYEFVEFVVDSGKE